MKSKHSLKNKITQAIVCEDFFLFAKWYHTKVIKRWRKGQHRVNQVPQKAQELSFSYKMEHTDNNL